MADGRELPSRRDTIVLKGRYYYKVVELVFVNLRFFVKMGSRVFRFFSREGYLGGFVIAQQHGKSQWGVAYISNSSNLPTNS